MAEAVRRPLRALLFFNAMLIFAGFVLLLGAPDTIPDWEGVDLDRSAYLMPYMLAATDLAFSVLSYYGTTITDAVALHIIVVTFVVFHIASALAQAYALAQGLAGDGTPGNIALRLILSGLFVYYGLYRARAAAHGGAS